MYKGTGRTFKFTQVDEKNLKEVIRALPRKSSMGDDCIAYTNIIDSEYYSAKAIMTITNEIITNMF